MDLITLESRVEEEQLDTMLQFMNYGNVTTFIHKQLWLGLDSLGNHEDSKRWSSKATRVGHLIVKRMFRIKVNSNPLSTEKT